MVGERAKTELADVDFRINGGYSGDGGGRSLQYED